MTGANVIRHSWNTYETGGATNAQQELMGSVGSGWFITRLSVKLRLLTPPLPNSLPSNVTVANWPVQWPITLIAGVQAGPTGYSPVSPTIANIGSASWWAVREASNGGGNGNTLSNPPYEARYLDWIWEADFRFGLKPQQAPEDFYLSFGWDNDTGNVAEFYSTGATEIWYG